MPSIYLYSSAETAYAQLDELIECGMIASVRRWEGSGQFMVTFDFH